MSGAGVADRSLDLLVTGAQDARHTVVLAHGAGQPMDGAAMELLAAAFTRAGVRVVRFEFPYMSRRRATGRSTAPDREPVLEQAWRSVIAQVAALPRLPPALVPLARELTWLPRELPRLARELPRLARELALLPPALARLARELALLPLGVAPPPRQLVPPPAPLPAPQRAAPPAPRPAP